mgnify:CR=1 FL=1|jgi:hypothetical protein
MDINIKYNNKKLRLDNVNEYSSIFRLKHEIYKKYNIDIENQQLRFNGILLKDNTPVRKYLSNNSTITINTQKLKGGSCGTSNLLLAIFGGLFFFGICVSGVIPIIVRIYWLLLVHMFKQAKDLLCKYDRIGAMVLGAAIGFLIMGGFVHINNDTTMYFWGIPVFMFIFCLIGSNRMISFFEPMFRKECIYLDPATRTIRKCRPTSPAKIGFVFVAIIKLIMACIRYAFIFLLVFVGVTYLELAALKYKHSCENYCDSLSLAKKVGKIATYVYVAFFILFNIPNYILYFVEACLSVRAFPFTIIKPMFRLFEGKLKKLANSGKYYISGLYFFLPIPFVNLIGIGFSTIHGMIDASVMALTKYTNDFKGYNCRVGMSKFIKTEIQQDKDLQGDIDKYKKDVAKASGNEEVIKPDSFKLSEYIKKLSDEFIKVKYIGSFNTDTKREDFIKDIETKTKEYISSSSDITLDRKEEFKSKSKVYIKKIFDLMVNRKGDLKEFLSQIHSMSDPIKNILTNIFITEDLKDDINSKSLFEKLDERQKLFRKKKYKWASDNEAEYLKQNIYRKLYCFFLYFISLFTGLVDSFGSPDDVKNEMKVSNVAGSACFFAWMVMASMIATGTMS